MQECLSTGRNYVRVARLSTRAHEIFGYDAMPPALRTRG